MARRAATSESAPRLRYEERISSLAYSGNIYALTIIIVAQFIYNFFHYIIGATLTVIAIASMLLQLALSGAAQVYLERKQMASVKHLLRVHFWLNHVILVLYMPFLVWTVILMYTNQAATKTP